MSVNAAEFRQLLDERGIKDLAGGSSTARK
jgi:hypothetical protein